MPSWSGHFREMTAKSVPRGTLLAIHPRNTPPSIAGRAGDRRVRQEGRATFRADVGVERAGASAGSVAGPAASVVSAPARERPLLGDRRARVDLAARGSTPTAFPAFHSSPGSEDDDPSDDRGVSGARMVGVTKPAPGFAADSDVDPAYDPYHVPALLDDAAAPIPRDASPPSPLPSLALVLALALACFGVGLAVGYPRAAAPTLLCADRGGAIGIVDDARLSSSKTSSTSSPRSRALARGCATSPAAAGAPASPPRAPPPVGASPPRSVSPRGAAPSAASSSASRPASSPSPRAASNPPPRDRADGARGVPGVRRGVDGAVRRGADGDGGAALASGRVRRGACAAAAWAAASAAPESPRWLIARIGA